MLPSGFEDTKQIISAQDHHMPPGSFLTTAWPVVFHVSLALCVCRDCPAMPHLQP
jgi:hypothetical protein